MTSIGILTLTPPEMTKLLTLEEGHFADVKAIEVTPAKLTRSLSAFANAEGGELFVGIDEHKQRQKRAWRGFNRIEDANGFLQVFEQLFPLGEEYSYNFLHSPSGLGYVLKVEIRKSRDVKVASDGKVYIRRGAQNLPVDTEEALARLRRNKGITSFETELVNVEKTLITNSTHIIQFMLEVVPTAEPEPWLKKQQVIIAEKPTVAGLVLFAEEPQAA
jgi:ATP-dependent DNA helicase RecG